MAKEIDYRNIDWEQHRKDCDKAYDDMVKKNESLGKGVVVGKVFRTQVADGYAYYEVMKVNKRTVKITWVDDPYLNPDQWHDQILGNGGSFPKHIIEGIVQREDALNKLFSKNKE